MVDEILRVDFLLQRPPLPVEDMGFYRFFAGRLLPGRTVPPQSWKVAGANVSLEKNCSQ